jgi:hypothetical protein
MEINDVQKVEELAEKNAELGAQKKARQVEAAELEDAKKELAALQLQLNPPAR